AAFIFYGELRARLLRRGAEESRAATSALATDVYRHAELPVVDLPPAPSARWLRATLALSPALLGVYAVISAVISRRPGAAVLAFTETCNHTFSTIPVRVIEADCHYLCTVAARGHAWIVKPERVGVRNGVPIVVNRQLAVANAFEDLLRQRWPRFGRWCRRAYDRLGLPVSRYITAPWMSDAVYVAMKPAEWVFYAFLLLVDRDDPERRIDRMYR
ncbi:MAG TPA: DUF6688 family protein, partial [Gemmatimonadaceae bacterium]|nr:DUF6688 family protein [Gemmatimonadaceae bacterium]